MIRILSFVAAALAGLMTVATGETFPPYVQNLTYEGGRTLSDWANLTVETRTGTFIGSLNDTYPNVRQFKRIPFSQVGSCYCIGLEHLQRISSS